MQHKRGFTLIELLVVVAVIAVLAGLLIPSISLIRRLANDATCGNNLRQIGAAVSVYSMSRNDEKFPGHLRSIVENGGDFVGLKKILLCPRDFNKGTGGYNREWDTPTNMSSQLWLDESGPAQQVHTSYLYEVSETRLLSDQYDFFYQDDPGYVSGTYPTPLPTWMEGKGVQLRTGNLGNPFPRAEMPIIRCFWHANWCNPGPPPTFVQSMVELKKVKNVSWDLNVFDSMPSWEHQINPAIPP
jgi:prepilin-type N-terminal cleavage/methylation domain-containing protein